MKYKYMVNFSIASEAEEQATSGAMKLFKPIMQVGDDILPIMMNRNQNPQQQQQQNKLQNSYSRAVRE
jgi:hypothetical protein